MLAMPCGVVLQLAGVKIHEVISAKEVNYMSKLLFAATKTLYNKEKQVDDKQIENDNVKLNV